MKNTKKLASILCLSLMMVLAFAFSGCGDKGMDPDTAISITQSTVNETYGYTYGDALAYYVGDINWSFSFEDNINSCVSSYMYCIDSYHSDAGGKIRRTRSAGRII